MKSQMSNPNLKTKKSEAIVESLQLPKDLFLGMPLLSIEGNRSVSIANHRGIVRYSSETVVVATKSYAIEITGRALVIPRFSKEMIEITGVVKSVNFLS
jgi:sporulation protein YqfC